MLLTAYLLFDRVFFSAKNHYYRSFYFTVNGMWSSWKIVSADHCMDDVNEPVKIIRFCDNPTPEFGGNDCLEPDYNQDEIACSNVLNAGEYYMTGTEKYTDR